METKLNQYLEQVLTERPLFPLTPADIRALRNGTSFVPPEANAADEASSVFLSFP